MQIKIEKIEKAEELLGSVDSLANFVEQMFLAHQMHDEQMFKFAHDSAAKIGFEITQKIQELELDRNHTCFYCEENKEPAKEMICQDCADLLGDASQ